MMRLQRGTRTAHNLPILQRMAVEMYRATRMARNLGDWTDVEIQRVTQNGAQLWGLDGC